MINLDFNSITPILPEVLEELNATLKSNFFLNPSSTHQLGKQAKNILEQKKTDIVNSLKAKCHDIYFVSGGTEANNMALNSQVFECIFTLQTEHDSILMPASKLNTKFIKIDENGIIDLNDLEEQIKKLNSKNFLCSVMLVNNESGVIQDINEIAKIVHKYEGLLHSDCSCAIGKIPFDFSIYDVDVITFSGNKIYSGIGGGCVIFKSGIPVSPFILGGGQQNFKRGGTENIPQIITIAKALQIVNEKNALIKFANHTKLLQQTIEKEVIQSGGSVFALNANRVSNTSFIKMHDINNFIQVIEFDLNDIAVSIGSACSSGKTQISHVLLACGLHAEDANKYIRISTSIYNTFEEIEKFLRIWKMLNKR